MKQVAMTPSGEALPRLLREAEDDDVVLTTDGMPRGLLVGFASEDDWFDFQLEHDPRFLARIAESREQSRSGRGIPIEQVEFADDEADAGEATIAERAKVR